MTRTPTPRPVRLAVEHIGQDLQTWRKLRGLTTAQVADRAGLSRPTVELLERGHPSSLETYLRIARALGILDRVVLATDPYETDIGRLRADQHLPDRVRRTR